MNTRYVSRANLALRELCLTAAPLASQDRCQFAHGKEELRLSFRTLRKRLVCHHFAYNGICRFGSRCRFLHLSPLEEPRRLDVFRRLTENEEESE